MSYEICNYKRFPAFDGFDVMDDTFPVKYLFQQYT
jgi:hypothetical protein